MDAELHGSVLLMTVPGLALFYAGMVRNKEVLATAAQSFAITALIVGAFAERMKFSALLWFTGLWSLLVYAPIAHMVWGPDGWLAADGVLDYAGGTVVHINAGIAGLVAALVMGKRIGYRHDAMHPNNLMYTMIGASLLWVGWFGFNAGSAVAASSDRAGMAMATTQIATAVAALSWMFAEWLARDKPTMLGMTSGAVAGLAAITPASGFVGPMGALWIGTAAGVICFWASIYPKNWMGYDDSLDAIGSFIILKAIDWTLGLRVKGEQERGRLDITQHGEQVYQ
ncbi:MAG: ammonium transporter [Acidithiobacillus sp.]